MSVQARAEDLADIRRLSTDLPELFRLGAAERGLRQAIMRILVKSVRTRRIAGGIEFVEIEYPSGASESFLAAVGVPKVPEAIREYALHRLEEQLREDRLISPSSEDVSRADAIADEMANRFKGSRHLTGWQLRACAIVAAYREPDADREAFQSAADLSSRYQLEATAIESVGMRDKLGPMRAVEGTPQFAPTIGELSKEFPQFGRRLVAADNEWEEADLISLKEASARLRRSWASSWTYADERGAHATDPSGRAWIHWPSVQGCVRATLAEAVAALGLKDVTVSDFMPATEAVMEIRRLVASNTWPWMGWPKANGSVGACLTVEATLDGHWQGSSVYMYLPSAVRELADPECVRAWLNGRLAGLTAWTPPRRVLRGQPKD